MDLESHNLDKIRVECETASSIPPENSCYVPSSSPSAGGPGLDSDFGASAGPFDVIRVKINVSTVVDFYRTILGGLL